MNGNVQNFISISAQQAKALRDAYDLLVKIDFDWAGVPTYNSNIHQADLDSVPSFNGLTTQELADGQNSLAVTKNVLVNELNKLQSFYQKVLGTL